MNDLFIDTCGQTLLVGLQSDGKLVRFSSDEKKKVAELVLPAIDFCLKEKGIAIKDIDRIYVTKGPGSYTGARIGLTVSKVLMLLNPHLKVFVKSTLEVLLSSVNMPSVALIDARNNAFFALVSGEENKLMRRMEMEELLSYLDEGYLPVFYKEANVIEDLKPYNPQTVDVLDAMIQNKDQFDEITDFNDIKPIYLKGEERYKEDFSVIEDESLKYIDAVLELEKDFNHPYTKNNITDDNERHIFVLLNKEEAIGYAYIHGNGDEKELYRIIVEKSYRNRGLGKYLLDEALKHSKCSRMLLEVELFNAYAIKLYISLGFKEYHLRKDYYGKGLDALMMEKVEDKR